jgi:hypothetical protein
MKNRHLFVVALVVGSGFANAGWSVEQNRPAGRPAATVAKPITNLPPTEEDCNSTGGKVTREFYGWCLSGHVCYRKDQNNRQYFVCIAKQWGTMRILALVVIATISFSVPCQAEQARGALSGAVTGIAKPTKTKPASLTTGECKGIGGVVQASEAFLCGSVCITTDPHGVVRRTCIADKP